MEAETTLRNLAGVVAGVDGEVAAALLAGAEALEREQWRPIETAPKDGVFLVYPSAHGHILIVGGEVLQTAMQPGTPRHLSLSPTHWRPLPTVPKEADRG